MAEMTDESGLTKDRVTQRKDGEKQGDNTHSVLGGRRNEDEKRKDQVSRDKHTKTDRKRLFPMSMLQTFSTGIRRMLSQHTQADLHIQYSPRTHRATCC